MFHVEHRILLSLLLINVPRGTLIKLQRNVFIINIFIKIITLLKNRFLFPGKYYI